MELEIGDKIWAKYGSTILVGNIVDTCPNKSLILISPMDCKTYASMKEDNRTDILGMWCDVQFMSLYDHEKGVGLTLSTKKVGFR